MSPRAEAAEFRRLRTKQVIFDPNQARKRIEKDPLGTLRVSLDALGQLTPVRVRYDPALDVFPLVDGHRRLLCIQELGWEWVDAMVVSGLDSLQSLAEQVTLNEAREPLSPFELAGVVERILQINPDLKHSEIASLCGVSESKLCFIQAILVADEHVKQLAEKNLLPQMGIYWASKAPNRESQIRLADLMASGQMTVEECRRRVYEESKTKKQERKPRKGRRTFKHGNVSLTAASYEELRSFIIKLRKLMRESKSLDDLDDRMRPPPPPAA